MNKISEFMRGRKLSLGGVFLGIGFVLLFFNMIYTSRFLMLDIFGEKADGQLVVQKRGCSSMRNSGKTCLNSYIQFITEDGKEYKTSRGGDLVEIWTAFTGFKDGARTHAYDVPIRYLGFFPYFAKPRLPFHIEYLFDIRSTPLTFLFIGVMFLITMPSRRNNRNMEQSSNMDEPKMIGPS